MSLLSSEGVALRFLKFSFDVAALLYGMLWTFVLAARDHSSNWSSNAYSSHNREYTDNYYTQFLLFKLHSGDIHCLPKNELIVREEESNWSFIVPNGIC
jgi:hypothetical protein